MIEPIEIDGWSIRKLPSGEFRAHKLPGYWPHFGIYQGSFYGNANVSEMPVSVMRALLAEHDRAETTDD